MPSYKGRGIESRLLAECQAWLPLSVEQITTFIANNDEQQRQVLDECGFVPVRMLQLGEEAQGFCELVKVLERASPTEKPSPLTQLAKQSPIHWN